MKIIAIHASVRRLHLAVEQWLAHCVQKAEYLSSSKSKVIVLSVPDAKVSQSALNWTSKRVANAQKGSEPESWYWIVLDAQSVANAEIVPKWDATLNAIKMKLDKRHHLHREMNADAMCAFQDQQLIKIQLARWNESSNDYDFVNTNWIYSNKNRIIEQN